MNIELNKRYSQEENEFLIENYPLHGSEFCAEKLNRSRQSIRGRVQKLKLKVNDLSSIMLKSCEKSNDQYNVNSDLFMNPTTPSVVYTLGLLWADGHIHIDKNIREIELSSTYPDGDEFYRIMSLCGKWNYYKYELKHKKYKKLKPRIVIKTNNRPLSDFLYSYGYGSKSEISADKILSIIPNDLKHYWFRGLVDGDGCIYVNKNRIQVSISGPYDQSWDYMKNLFSELSVTFELCSIKSKTKNHKSSRIRVSGRKNASKFLEYIYKDVRVDGIGLTRKFEKWKTIQNLRDSSLKYSASKSD